MPRRTPPPRPSDAHLADPRPTRTLTLGTAGHIDHGKTALIEALTGTNTDRLAEERRRGISIELGFARLELPNEQALSVVDVPGHERLVKTMVAGASGIDLFLMVVAADEGVMPQTREHAAVLRALGVRAGVVALTKCDRADPQARALAKQQAAKLLGAMPLVEVSAVTGEGVAELREALFEIAESIEAERADRRDWPPRAPVLHVDRSFSLPGIGTVVTGTLWSGEIAAGERVRILPSGREARVRSVEVHGGPRRRAREGERTALNLAGVAREEVARGDAITATGSRIAASYRLDVELLIEPGAGNLGGQRVQVHHGTRDVPARVVSLGRDLAQLRLEAPLLARAGDHAVLRRIAPPDTLGGARVLDPFPARHGPGPAAKLLELLRGGEPEELLEQAVARGIPAEPEAWVEESALAAALPRWPRSRWLDAVERLVSAGVAERRQGKIVAPTHDEHPAAVEPPPLDSRALALLEELTRDGLQPRAPAALADAAGLEREAVVERLERLVAAGRAARVKPGVYYEASALADARRRIVEVAGAAGSVSIAELRDALGTSRKYAQALLEHLDSEKVTVRHGDRHILRARR
jgi:selenocysteine-specific elongation factor